MMARARNECEFCKWQSYRFWTATPKQIAQYWYVTFCLLMSAIQDSLIGMFLQNRRNLNWSVTTSYYGMVHTGRLLCFVASGSFPTGHKQLCKLFYNPTETIQLNWLETFVRDLGRNDPGPNNVRTSVCGHDIINRLRGWGVATDRELETFGIQMDRLRDLRNNSNYEALLIAHEKKHVVVTDCFAKLAECAQVASSDSLDLAVRVYRQYMEETPLFNQDRSIFKYLSNDYVKGRMYMGIKEKLRYYPPASDKLRGICETLKFSGLTESCDKHALGRIEDNISIRKFGGKTVLMESFQRKVDGFCVFCNVNGSC